MEYSGQTLIDIIKYDLKLELFPLQKGIKGEADISFRIRKGKENFINLDLYDNLEVKFLSFDNKSTKFVQSNDKLKIYIPDTSDTLAKVKIKYEGEPSNLGFGSFNVEKHNDHFVIYTLNAPFFASTWFPCKDVPSDKALLRISIKNDSNYTSVSNGILKEVITDKNKRTYVWETKYPIATYLITLNSAIYKNFQNSFKWKNKEMLLDYYVFPELLDDAKKDFEDHNEYLEVFSELFGEYPFLKEKYGVATILWQSGAMENQTITTIGSNFITGRKFFQDILIHETAHSWWGNAVTPKSWKDVWLNEGFATYCEALYFEKKYGREALSSTMMSKFNTDFQGTLYDPGMNVFSSTVYDKGAWTLHMLRYEIGDSSFFRTLREYYETYKFKNASTYDFQKIAENVSKKDLDKFFQQWVFTGEGILKFEYHFNQSIIEQQDYLEIHLKQTQKLYKWFQTNLDIQIIYEDDTWELFERNIIKDEKTVLRFPIKKNVKDIKIDPINWLLAEFIEI